MKYAIINCFTNEALTFNDEIEFGFTLDDVLDNLDRYDLKYKLISYNFGKVYVIK